VLVKDKDRWRLDKPLHADADRQKVTDLLSRLSSLEARAARMCWDGADPKTYGLDPPAEGCQGHGGGRRPRDDGRNEGKGQADDAPVLTFRIGKARRRL